MFWITLLLSRRARFLLFTVEWDLPHPHMVYESTWISIWPFWFALALAFINRKFAFTLMVFSTSSAFAFQTTTGISPVSSDRLKCSTVPVIVSVLNFAEGESFFHSTLQVNVVLWSCYVLYFRCEFADKRPSSFLQWGSISISLFSPMCNSIFAISVLARISMSKPSDLPDFQLFPVSTNSTLSFHNTTRIMPFSSKAIRLAIFPLFFPQKSWAGKIVTTRQVTVTSFSPGIKLPMDRLLSKSLFRKSCIPYLAAINRKRVAFEISPAVLVF